MVVNTLYGTAKNLMKHSCKMHMLIAHVHCEINLRKKNKIKSLAYFHIDRYCFTLCLLTLSYTEFLHEHILHLLVRHK